MWAARRRTIILLIVISTILLLVVFPYWLTHRQAPTCFDGERNQDEVGIDCGGACALVCRGGAKDLKVIWTKVFAVRAGIYDIVSYLENANFEIGAPRVPFSARLYDAENNVIAEESGETYALPSERFALFIGNVRTGDKVAVRSEIDLPNDFRWMKEPKPENIFVVEDKLLTGADKRPKLSAWVQNLTPEVYRDVDVTAIIYDAKGEPIGVSKTRVEKIDKNGREQVFFTWSLPFNYIADTEQCETPVDVILALDRSGSMVSDGKDPPQPLTAAKLAAAQFITRLSQKDQGAYVSFASGASNPIDQPLTADVDRLRRSIERTTIHSDGIQFTNIGDGIVRAVDEFASFRHSEEARPVIVLLTDGIPTRPEDPNDTANKEYPSQYAREVAEKAKSQGISIYTIGLGADVNATLLEEVATSPEYYYPAASGAELGEVYQQIATAICKKGPSVIEIIPRVKNVQPL